MKPNQRKFSASPEGMNRILKQAEILLNQEQLEQLWRFHTYLRQENEKLNLTRIYQFENIVRKHYVDSIIVLQILQEKGIRLPERILDMGSGAGFPGIPLAIADPRHHYILNDARTVRTDYLEEAIRVVGLKNASVLPKKIYSGFHYPVRAVITRAVASMEATLDRLEGCLSGGGIMIFLKGPHCDGEISQVEQRWQERASLLLDHSYTLPDSRDHRRLVVWQLAAMAHSGAPAQESHEERDSALTIPITSPENARYKVLKSLSSSRGIKKQKLALLYGVKLIREFLEDQPERAEAFILSSRSEEQNPDRRPELEYPEIPRYLLDESLFRTIDVAGTGSPLLLFRADPLLEWEEEKADSSRVLVLPLSNPENLGASLRSAAAFGFQDVILTAEAANPYLPQALRASAGQLFRLRLWKGPSLRELQSAHTFYSLESDGEEIARAEIREPYLLVVGEEGQGVPDSLRTTPLRIPMEEGVESLNASVALGIALYELRKRDGRSDPSGTGGGE